MKKFTLLFLLSAWMGAASLGAEELADTLFYYRGHTITVADSAETFSIQLRDSAGRTVEPYYESRYRADGKRERTWHLTDTFDYPFSDIIGSKRKKDLSSSHSGHRFDPHWEGLGFGFCTAVGTGRGGLNGPEGVMPNMARSFEIFWNIFSVHIPINRRNVGLVSGFGLNWRNYRMDAHYRFVKHNVEFGVEGYPEGASIKFSRLKTFDLTVPLLLELQTLSDREFFMSVGGVLNIKTHASLLTRYELDGDKVKETAEDLHQNPVTIDIMGMVGYGNLAAYVKYSPFHICQTRYAPEMQSLSAGVMLLY